MLSPIVIFAFNRPQSLQALIESLQKNSLAKESELFIFIDEARQGKKGEKERVLETQQIAKSVTGFKNIICEFSTENKGLRNSIIQGVSKIIEKYNKAIILEDDLILSSNFLEFMNQGLKQYEKEQKVFSICGYGLKIKISSDYKYDSYFCTRSSSWGWATWKDRWQSVNWDISSETANKNKKNFNKWGGSDCYNMLLKQINGDINSWAVHFCFSQFLQNKLSLFPIVSKVQNTGFDEIGTHTKQKWSRFKIEFDTSRKTEFEFPKKIEFNKEIHEKILKYHSIIARIYSKLRILYEA